MHHVGVRVVVVVTALLAVVALAAVVHHGGAASERTALAISRIDPVGDGGDFRLVTECADHVEVEVGRDAGGSDLPQITVWGRPRVGRCDAGAAVSLPPAAFRATDGHPPLTQVVDGATSQVVDLPS